MGLTYSLFYESEDVILNISITNDGYRIAQQTASVHIRFVFNDGTVVDTVINPYVTIERYIIISLV